MPGCRLRGRVALGQIVQKTLANLDDETRTLQRGAMHTRIPFPHPLLYFPKARYGGCEHHTTGDKQRAPGWTWNEDANDTHGDQKGAHARGDLSQRGFHAGVVMAPAF